MCERAPSDFRTGKVRQTVSSTFVRFFQRSPRTRRLTVRQAVSYVAVPPRAAAALSPQTPAHTPLRLERTAPASAPYSFNFKAFGLSQNPSSTLHAQSPSPLVPRGPRPLYTTDRSPVPIGASSSREPIGSSMRRVRISSAPRPRAATQRTRARCPRAARGRRR